MKPVSAHVRKKNVNVRRKNERRKRRKKNAIVISKDGLTDIVLSKR
jgi:hypothetical protein